MQVAHHIFTPQKLQQFVSTLYSKFEVQYHQNTVKFFDPGVPCIFILDRQMLNTIYQGLVEQGACHRAAAEQMLWRAAAECSGMQEMRGDRSMTGLKEHPA